MVGTRGLGQVSGRGVGGADHQCGLCNHTQTTDLQYNKIHIMSEFEAEYLNRT